MNKKYFSTALKFTFIICAFIFLFRPETFGAKPDLFHDISVATLIDALRGLDPATAAFWLSFAAVIKIAGIFAGITRWRILLRAQGVHIPFWYLTKCWFWGRAIGLWLPGTLGLDGYRMVESSRYTGEVVKCTTVIIIEKLCGFIALFTLVFLTLPLGLRLFPINLALLGVVLVILAGFITVCLTLLFQPRIIQVIAGVLPTPKKLRDVVDKLGTAATAYGAHKGALLKALFFGLCVHVGICLMYFGTASAIRAENTGILDILFASPLIIVGSVFAPTVSGVGVREVVMTTLLGGTAGGQKAFIFGHLGLWFGEIIPFVLSLPLLLLTTAPKREDLLEEIESVRETARRGEEAIHLDPEVIAGYRAKVYATAAAATLGGLAAGALLGLAEAAWLWYKLPGLTEYAMFIWGPITYGILFAGVGAGMALGLLFLYLLFNRFAPWTVSYALGLGGALAAGGLVIGLWRYKRDILGSDPGTTQQLGQVAALILGIVCVLTAITYIKAHVWSRITKNRPAVLLFTGVLAWGGFIALGAAVTQMLPAPQKSGAALAPPESQSTGPNIILIAIDTLRADYLKLYAEAEANTPHIDALAQDAVLFELSMSQASWTKPAFGTMFTGLYPEMHRATTKTALLPASVDTVAELLHKGGYHTQGFANNPNVSAIFGFDQGFDDYIYLKPRLYFWASDSAAKLSMYEVLRKVRMTAKSKISKRIPFLFKINVKDYYQPGEVVTEEVLDWIDTSAPQDKPIYLYTHYMDSHDPFMDPDAKTGGYARSNNPHPDPETFTEPMRKAYIREIEHLDTAIGDFIAGLKSRDLYDDALILFTSDHGEEFQEHGGWWHGFTLYEEMTHVPMILKLPGNQLAGTRDENFARHIDIAPTFLHFAGLPKGPLMAGISLVGADGQLANGNTLFSYAENDFEGNVLHAIRDWAGKVITANPENPSGLAPLESYDLREDPGEQENLTDTEAWVTGLLDEIGKFKKAISEGAVAAESGVVNPALQEQLEALGYLGDAPQLEEEGQAEDGISELPEAF